MKIVQIVGNFVHWDATRDFPTLASTEGKFAPDIKFVEAPDNVFEGWGYVDGEFIQPTPPEGWLYDEATGTFYQEGWEPPPPPPTINDAMAQVNLLKKQLQASSDYTDFLEDCIAEMAQVVYSE